MIDLEKIRTMGFDSVWASIEDINNADPQDERWRESKDRMKSIWDMSWNLACQCIINRASIMQSDSFHKLHRKWIEEVLGGTN